MRIKTKTTDVVDEIAIEAMKALINVKAYDLDKKKICRASVSYAYELLNELAEAKRQR